MFMFTYFTYRHIGLIEMLILEENFKRHFILFRIQFVLEADRISVLRSHCIISLYSN